MRVMIMAAGKGTRLRPVTDLLPKPMAPIVNRPALYHILRLLQRHGFREVVINLHHLPDVITGYFGDGAGMGMDITLLRSSPNCSGTAGGVKNNEDFLGAGTFLVMSGDALTDIDLTGLVAAHRRNGSIATMAVKEVADPSLYGVVVTDDDGRVVGFQEKPTREEARSRLCNCGIYVFEPEILVAHPGRAVRRLRQPGLPRPAQAARPLPRPQRRRLLERRGQSGRVHPGQRRRADRAGSRWRSPGAEVRPGSLGRTRARPSPTRCASSRRW